MTDKQKLINKIEMLIDDIENKSIGITCVIHSLKEISSDLKKTEIANLTINIEWDGGIMNIGDDFLEKYNLNGINQNITRKRY